MGQSFALQAFSGLIGLHLLAAANAVRQASLKGCRDLLTLLEQVGPESKWARRFQPGEGARPTDGRTSDFQREVEAVLLDLDASAKTLACEEQVPSVVFRSEVLLW